MRWHLLVLWLLCSFQVSLAQELSGTVLDEQQQTVPGATVYLNGTSIWAITDDSGRYVLRSNSKVSTELVVSALGFEPYVLSDPYAENPARITLRTSATKLREVKVQAALFTRREMLKRFREEFLGNTKAGRSCKIKNEDDLEFQYDPETFIFTAQCDTPILVENPHLGFDMEFTLVDFQVQFRSRTLHRNEIRQWMLSGTTLYKAYQKGKRYEKARAKTYEGSQMQFFRLLTRRALGRENFALHYQGWPCNPDTFFNITNENGLYKVTVAKNPEKKGVDEFLQVFALKHKNGDVSSLTIKTPVFHVDRFGNYDSFDKVNFSGPITKKRAGDLLPADYGTDR